MHSARLVHIVFGEYCWRRRPNSIGHSDILRRQIHRRNKEGWLGTEHQDEETWKLNGIAEPSFNDY